MAADKKAADEEALIEADILPSASMDHLPPSNSDNDSSSNSGCGGAGTSNPPVNRVVVVPDLYDHIQNNASDDDSDSYEEDEEDKRLITIANRANKRTERIV